MSIEAMKQALEALEEAHPKPYNDSVISHVEAITALRTAIAETEKQEPVALETVYQTIIQWDEGGGKRSRRELARRIVALYTTPQSAAQDNAFEKLARAVRDFATEQRAIQAKLKEKSK